MPTLTWLGVRWILMRSSNPRSARSCCSCCGSRGCSQAFINRGRVKASAAFWMDVLLSHFRGWSRSMGFITGVCHLSKKRETEIEKVIDANKRLTCTIIMNYQFIFFVHLVQMWKKKCRKYGPYMLTGIRRCLVAWRCRGNFILVEETLQERRRLRRWRQVVDGETWLEAARDFVIKALDITLDCMENKRQGDFQPISERGKLALLPAS